MDKKVYAAVRERSGNLCEECGRPYPSQHHVFGGRGRRKKCEMIETVFDLCYLHHQDGKHGIHFNKELADKYKAKATLNLLNLGWTREQIIQFVGKWYL